MKPKIVFLDADGTLWTFHGLYQHSTEQKRTLSKTTLDPATLQLLKALKKKKIETHIVSYQSFTSHHHARRKLKSWLRHFKIAHYITEIHIADKQRNQKSKVITRILSEKNYQPKDALLIGDRYRWDYQEAKKALVPAILLTKPENKKHKLKTYTLDQIAKRFS